MNFSIREITKACGGELVLREGTDIDTCVSSVAINSNLVQPGGVFIATEGERVDGHKFIPAAFQRGAALVLTRKTPEQVEAEHNADRTQWGSYLLVEDPLQALKDMAEAYRRKLSVKVVGITGSSGKTSTKEFIAGVLSMRYRVLKTEGNFNNEIGVPLTLLNIREEHEVAVVEMGISEFGEMHRLSKMARPDICVITNIGQSHLNNLIDRDGILRAKSEIFDYMAPDGEICLNGEDDKLVPLREIRGHRPHFFGLGGSSREEVVMGDIRSKGLWGSEARLMIKQENQESRREIPVRIPLPGEHMALNAAAAACVAALLGLTDEEIAAGIAGVNTISGRTNIIRRGRYTIIDDCYNANPASVSAAIDLLALADTEKVAILGDMLNLGEETQRYHREAGIHAARAGAGRILCVGEESRYMYQGAYDNAAQTAKVFHFPDTEALLKGLETDLAGLVPEGSTVLIKASHDMGFAKVLEYLQSRAE